MLIENAALVLWFVDYNSNMLGVAKRSATYPGTYFETDENADIVFEVSYAKIMIYPSWD